MTRTYSVETIIAGVGYIRPAERIAIRNILGLGSAVHHSQVSNELRLSWNLDADAMEEAIDAARTLHFTARQATGVYVPHTSLFQVCETGLERQLRQVSDLAQ